MLWIKEVKCDLIKIMQVWVSEVTVRNHVKVIPVNMAPSAQRTADPTRKLL